MIIIGDIASPSVESSLHIKQFIENLNLSKEKAILFNLEGLIVDDYTLTDKKPILFNHSSILEAFECFDTKIAALANNHTLDLPKYLETSKSRLKSKNYLFVGAGNSNDENFEITSFYEDGFKVYVINACWEFLLYHQNNSKPQARVNVISEERILEIVKHIKYDNPDAKIITYFHWSFDLEILPSPSYRVFSKDLIDAGVSLVIGGHSHCVQGGERYKDGYILYGLGNFYIPNGVYANGKLNFPTMSNLGWMVSWDIKENKIVNYWMDSSNNYLKLNSVDEFDNSKILKRHSEYSGLDNIDYVHFFKENRRKNTLNPIFYDFKRSTTNSSKLLFLIFRAKIARTLAKMNIINWQN